MCWSLGEVQTLRLDTNSIVVVVVGRRVYKALDGRWAQHLLLSHGRCRDSGQLSIGQNVFIAHIGQANILM